MLDTFLFSFFCVSKTLRISGALKWLGFLCLLALCSVWEAVQHITLRHFNLYRVRQILSVSFLTFSLSLSLSLLLSLSISLFFLSLFLSLSFSLSIYLSIYLSRLSPKKVKMVLLKKATTFFHSVNAEN